VSNESEIQLTWDRVGNAGIGVLRIVHADGVFVDKFDITKMKERTLVLEGLGKELPGLSLDDVQAQLEDLAGKAVPRDGVADDGDSQADLLVALTEGDDVELFRAPGEQDTGGYATVNVDGRMETWPIVSTGFKGWLRREFYKRDGKAVRAQALVDALGLIEAKALYEGDEHPVSLRVAAHEGDVFIDLGTEDRRAIHITAAGWNVVESVSVPVRFIRR